MLLKTPLLKASIISFSEKTIINFGENLEFTLFPEVSGSSTYIFHLQDIKGDFEITKIRSQGGSCDIPYDNVYKTFVTDSIYSSSNFEFHILTEIDFKNTGYVNVLNFHFPPARMGLFKLKFKVLYQLQIPSARMKMLKLYECYEERFAFVGHEYMKLNYYI